MKTQMQILNVTRNDDGQFEVIDQRGKLIEGPFDTNAAAWKALDRLDHDNALPSGKARKVKKVRWGRPENKSKSSQRRQKKLQKKQAHRMKVNAANAPNWVRSVAAAKFDPAGKRAYRDHKLGTFGAASEMRRIDVAAYLAEKAARGEA
ncbi:hypothetical protein [Sinorhizobium fredii]|uniref:hypothetical protein n=1 Tax=Rhizobium fredii TaxID=380 RepID=UPI0021092F63|nr:hypothetical protein [Sinorhizobium fredii]UTY50442.1 hypothetical protein EPK84_28660 [Sinorhizobium fredii]